jgi:hypothetical protein
MQPRFETGQFQLRLAFTSFTDSTFSPITCSYLHILQDYHNVLTGDKICQYYRHLLLQGKHVQRPGKPGKRSGRAASCGAPQSIAINFGK